MGRKGFSTIEMIIVVILIGIIASIGFPRLRDGLESRTSGARRRWSRRWRRRRAARRFSAVVQPRST